MLIDVKTAVADYLEHCELRRQAARLSAGCLSNYRFALAPFASAFGSRLVHALAAENGRLEVEAWAGGLHPGRDGKPAPWSDTYQNVVLGVIGSVFKRAGWPVKFDRPATESRGPEAYLTDDQFARVLAAIHPGRRPKSDLAELLTVLRESGHRPSEVWSLTAETLDWEHCLILLKKHKTYRKVKRPLPKVFNSAAMAVLHKQREKYGTGLLFRTSKGTAFTRATIAKQLAVVSERVGFWVIAYGQRHSAATNMLEAGIPETMVAAILGHCSTQMVNKHYSHVGSRADAMRAAAERVVRK
jgi:integrase